MCSSPHWQVGQSWFREKLSPANREQRLSRWADFVKNCLPRIVSKVLPRFCEKNRALGRKKNGVQHATAIYPIPRYTRPRYIGLTLYLLFVSWQSDHFWLSYRKFHIWHWKFKVKVKAKIKPDGHIWGLGVQLICLLFVSWQSHHFWLRYSKFYIWPWKFKVKVMAKVKPDGHIWALEFNRYVCIPFRGNRTIFGWDIANSIFDLEKSRWRSQQKSTKI